MTEPDPLTAYYATEYQRRNMQVARVCGAQASVHQALERALTIKSIPNWMIAYLKSAAMRLPGLQHDLAAWRDLAPDAPEHVRADPAVILAAAMELPEVKALADLLLEARNDLEVYIGVKYPEVYRARHPSVQRQWHRDMELCRRIDASLAALKPDAKGGV